MINSVIIEGNLTRDVEIKHTSTGITIANLSLAYNDSYKKKNEWIKETSFFDITAFNTIADSASSLIKGESVHIEGKIKQDRFEKDGKTQSKVKIIAFKVEPMARNNAPNVARTGQGATQPAKATSSTIPNQGRPSTVPFKDDIPGDNSDIPF